MPVIDQTCNSHVSNSTQISTTGGFVSDLSSDDGSNSFSFAIGGWLGGAAEMVIMGLPALPVEAVGINSCNQYAKTQGTGGYSAYVFNGSVNVSAGAPSSWTDLGVGHAFSTVSEINSSNCGGGFTNTGNFTWECTYVHRVTDYIAAGMTFVAIYHLLLPLIGSSMTFCEFMEVMKLAQQWRAGSKITYKTEEISEFWKEYKHGLVIPRYCFLGI